MLPNWVCQSKKASQGCKSAWPPSSPSRTYCVKKHISMQNIIFLFSRIHSDLEDPRVRTMPPWLIWYQSHISYVVYPLLRILILNYFIPDTACLCRILTDSKKFVYLSAFHYMAQHCMGSNDHGYKTCLLLKILLMHHPSSTKNSTENKKLQRRSERNIKWKSVVWIPHAMLKL